MQRDWDVIREILIRLEKMGPGEKGLRVDDFEEERRDLVTYQMGLLIEEARLVHGRMLHSFSDSDFVAMRLTWQGHEFLDAIKSDTVWEKTKRTFIAEGLSMTFDLVKSVAAKLAAEILKTQIL